MFAVITDDIGNVSDLAAGLLSLLLQNISSPVLEREADTSALA